MAATGTKTSKVPKGVRLLLQSLFCGKVITECVHAQENLKIHKHKRLVIYHNIMPTCLPPKQFYFHSVVHQASDVYLKSFEYLKDKIMELRRK